MIVGIRGNQYTCGYLLKDQHPLPLMTTNPPVLSICLLVEIKIIERLLEAPAYWLGPNKISNVQNFDPRQVAALLLSAL